MNKTVLITGCSSGIGRATALQFQQQGWNVVATMRSPEKSADLSQLANVLCLPLDVTDPATIEAAIASSLAKFGAIDALINNAGYALVGPFEACTTAEIQRQFDTNVFGLMAVTRALLPHFRERRQGVIVNVASIGGQIAIPLYSPYHASKWAVEGFSESLSYELRPFNIRVKIIEPGPIKTDFYQRSLTVSHQPGLTDYDAYVNQVLPKINHADQQGSPPDVTAQVIYRATTDGKKQLRYPAGGNASQILALRKLLPDSWMQGLIHLLIER